MGEADSGTDWFRCRRDGQGQLLAEGGDLRDEQCWGREVRVGVRKEAWGLWLGLLGPGKR